MLKSAADTTLIEGSADNNMGADPTMIAGATAHGPRGRALLRFDLTGSIPVGATIISAVLQMNMAKASSLAAVDSTFELRRILVSWGEGTKLGSVGAAADPGEATWNARLAPSTLWAAPGGAEGTDFASTASAILPMSAPAIYTFSSTPRLVADVQDWLDHSDANFGWMLRSQGESDPGTARRFTSREDAANAPTLTVEYSTVALAIQITGIQVATTNGLVTWSGGLPPFQLQTKPTLTQTNWTNVGLAVQTNGASFLIETEQAFFRVIQLEAVR